MSRERDFAKADRRRLYRAWLKHSDAIDRAVWADLDLGHRVARLLERCHGKDNPARRELLPLLLKHWGVYDEGSWRSFAISDSGAFKSITKQETL